MINLSKIFYKEKSIIPGFPFTFGFTIFYLLIIVIIPLIALISILINIELSYFLQILFDKRILSAFFLTFSSAIIAAIISTIFGVIIAILLTRYNFYGKKFIDSLIDLPFAIPTAVAGIALAALYSKDGILGSILYMAGINIIFTKYAIIIALIFVSFPFVVRSVQPAILALEDEIEEAASLIGANSVRIIFKIILPSIMPSIITGFTMAFARSLSEYGSVIFVSSNIPMVSEIVAVTIVSKLEAYDYEGASAIAFLMLLFSFILLFIINLLNRYNDKK